MRRIVLQNSAGFTLVEVLIASVVALLVYLALMQTALVGLEAGTRNNLRDEAVSVATKRMDDARAQSFTALVSDTNSLSAQGCNSCPGGTIFPYTTGACVTRSIKNISLPYCTNLTAAPLDPYVTQVTVTVGWKWKGTDYTHRIISTVRKY
jgi:prepilin-type N-terminal cleavage/methylation domain-containing protein